MDEESIVCEKLEQLAKENRTWEILKILNECETLEEAIKKVEALLNK